MDTCSKCGELIPDRRKRKNARYCSKTCERETAKMRYRKANPPTGVPTGTVGAIGELLVAADLMRKGYDVFRSMSPSCPCDIAILKDGALSRVEVTTGKKLPSGKIMSPPHKEHTYDVLAVVLYDHGAPAIIYEPEL